MPNMLILLLIATFLKGLVFSIVIPIWHTPDEQAHFAQVAYFGEFNKMPKSGFDLNREILEAERLLGTERDEKGNNKFTFHPEYRIEYTNSTQGKYEEEIENFPNSYRRELVKYESANYPPLYYWLTGAIYKIFYQTDLITRVYLARFISILTGVGVVFFSWLISKELFPKNKLLQVTLPILVSFQPMFSFLTSGVSSDNLFNLLFTALIWTSVVLISKGLSLKYLVFSLSLLTLTFLTKPQFMLAIPMLVLALIFSFLLDKKASNSVKAGAFFLCLISLPLIYFLVVDLNFYQIIEKIYVQSFFPGTPVTQMSFYSFLKETFIHTIAEVTPWYWGVFNWLGVTLPRDIHRVINRIMILAAIGVVIKLLLVIRKRSYEDYLFIYLILASLIYFLGITYYNYLFSLSHGFPFGIQGRYYFPTLVAHIAILLLGLSTLVPSSLLEVKKWVIKGLGASMIILNFITAFILAKSYYDLSDVNVFLTQLSQYKPIFFKGNLIILWVSIYLVILTIFLFKYLQFKQDEKRS